MNIKKRILLALCAGVVIAASACTDAPEDKPGESTAPPAVNVEAELSPDAAIEIENGEVKGLAGIVTAGWLKSQFTSAVTVVSKNGDTVADDKNVPSDSTVTLGGGTVATVTVKGDADMNGAVDSDDVTAINDFIKNGGDKISESAADVDRDGEITGKDVEMLQSYIDGEDVKLFDGAIMVSVFKGGVTEYKLLSNGTDTDSAVASLIKEITGKDIETVSEVKDGERFITVGKDLYTKYDFIDEAAVKALDETGAYIHTRGGNVYLTANSDKGIEGCLNYLGYHAFNATLDMEIPKGTVGVLGDLETLIRPVYTTVEIEGLKTSHRLLHLSDTHLTTVYEDEETPERRADVMARLNNWMMNMYRKPSYLYFNEYFDFAESINAEAIMLTGDITDSPSKSNRDIFEKAVDGCSVPSYYIYGNHDWSWNDNASTGDKYHDGRYRTEYNKGFAQIADNAIEDWKEFYNVIEHEDYTILAIDNAWQGWPSRRDVYLGIKETLDKAKEESKPVILMIHVPIHVQEMHDSIDRITGNGYCVSGYNGRKEVYEMIVAEDSPVKAIFCGHVHESYVSMVEGRIPQYMIGAGLEGWCRVVDLVPAK